ncbi:MAG: hypothetical protein MHM6MM_004586 [Cercozoa sp. M6MM]
MSDSDSDAAKMPPPTIRRSKQQHNSKQQKQQQRQATVSSNLARRREVRPARILPAATAGALSMASNCNTRFSRGTRLPAALQQQQQQQHELNSPMSRSNASRSHASRSNASAAMSRDLMQMICMQQQQGPSQNSAESALSAADLSGSLNNELNQLNQLHNNDSYSESQHSHEHFSQMLSQAPVSSQQQQQQEQSVRPVLQSVHRPVHQAVHQAVLQAVQPQQQKEQSQEGSERKGRESDDSSFPCLDLDELERLIDETAALADNAVLETSYAGSNSSKETGTIVSRLESAKERLKKETRASHDVLRRFELLLGSEEHFAQLRLRRLAEISESTHEQLTQLGLLLASLTAATSDLSRHFAHCSDEVQRSDNLVRRKLDSLGLATVVTGDLELAREKLRRETLLASQSSLPEVRALPQQVESRQRDMEAQLHKQCRQAMRKSVASEAAAERARVASALAMNSDGHTEQTSGLTRGVMPTSQHVAPLAPFLPPPPSDSNQSSKPVNMTSPGVPMNCADDSSSI